MFYVCYPSGTVVFVTVGYERCFLKNYATLVGRQGRISVQFCYCFPPGREKWRAVARVAARSLSPDDVTVTSSFVQLASHMADTCGTAALFADVILKSFNQMPMICRNAILSKVYRYSRNLKSRKN
jgi:hypothetical protein